MEAQTAEEANAKLRVIEAEAVALVDQQGSGYNNGEIEEFLEPYSDSVQVFNFRKGLDYRGKEQMRALYTNLFEKYPDLHCAITNRIVHGNKVIDHETVNFAGREVTAVAIYHVENKKIAEVHFLYLLD